MLPPLNRLKERRQLKEDLEELMKDERFKRFFRLFLRQSGVTRTQFSNDPYVIVAEEATRRLAMSYLHLMVRDDPQHLINEIENQHQTKEYDE